jgi:hypothetical protein
MTEEQLEKIQLSDSGFSESIFLTNDCFLCDEFSLFTNGVKYCKFYYLPISSVLLPLWKYKNTTELHCIHYQREKESIKNKEI